MSANAFPVLTVHESKIYLDGVRVRSVSNYSIIRGEARDLCAKLNLTILIDPELNINDREYAEVFDRRKV